MFGIFKKKFKNIDQYISYINTQKLGFVAISVYVDMHSAYYRTPENRIDVRRVEASIYNLFHAYFVKKYSDYATFLEDYCTGGNDIITIRFEMRKIDGINYVDSLSKEVDKEAKKFVDDLIAFKDFVNENRTEDDSLQIAGIKFAYRGKTGDYNELAGTSDERLYRSIHA